MPNSPSAGARVTSVAYKLLKFLVDTHLSKESVASAGFVRYEKVRDIVSRFEKGEDYLFNRVWVLVLLHKWNSQ